MTSACWRLAAAALVVCGGLAACELDQPTPPEPTPTVEPSPTPTLPTFPPFPTPTPPPPEPTPTVPADPRIPAGWPGPRTTGAEPCATLRPSGSVTITVEGAELVNTCVKGTLTIRAADVVIRNVWVDGAGKYPVWVDRGASALLEDVTVDGNTSEDPAYASTAAIYLKGSATIRRADVHDVGDGPRVEADDVTLEDSWVHHLTRVPGGHHDALQMRDGLRAVIRHNTLDAYDYGAGTWLNAAIMLGSPLLQEDGTYDPISLRLERNYLNGGTYTVRLGAVPAGQPEWVTDSVAVGNVFGPDFGSAPTSAVAKGWDWQPGNVAWTTGKPVRGSVGAG